VVVIQRNLGGLVRYRTVFFAPPAAIGSIVCKLKPMELVRFFYGSQPSDHPHRAIRSERSFTICNDLSPPVGQLWDGLAHSTRTDIRKAEALGDRVRIVRNGEAPIKDFLAVFNDFARRKDGVRPISSRLLERYAPFADRIVLYLDQHPTSVMLMLRDPDGGRVRGMYYGSRRLAASAAAREIGNLNRLLHWHSMCAYKREGFCCYDWGGISQDRNDGRARFKRAFGGHVVEEYGCLYAGWPLLGVVMQSVLELTTARGRLARLSRSSGN